MYRLSCLMHLKESVRKVYLWCMITPTPHICCDCACNAWDRPRPRHVINKLDKSTRCWACCNYVASFFDVTCLRGQLLFPLCLTENIYECLPSRVGQSKTLARTHKNSTCFYRKIILSCPRIDTSSYVHCDARERDDCLPPFKAWLWTIIRDYYSTTPEHVDITHFCVKYKFTGRCVLWPTSSAISGFGEDYIHSQVSLNIPPHINNLNDAIIFLFPRTVLADPVVCLKCALLSPKNSYVDDFNAKISPLAQTQTKVTSEPSYPFLS
jgi:hypothetical protein